MADENLEGIIADLKAKNAALEDQLRFARHKASLYYITASELDALKRGKEDFVERKSIGVSTCEDGSSASSANGVSSETQTEFASDSLAQQVELDSMRADNTLLRCMNESLTRSESLRARALSRARELAAALEAGDSPGIRSQIDLVLSEYTSLLEEYVLQNRMSVKHTFELKRRDEMISSLFEKIRMLEDAFSRKLMETSKIADTRQEVIRELGDQIKDAINLGRSDPEPQETFDWTDMAAIHSEMEDLRAELSKARTNWAATRDELIRLQFRVGVDGRGNDKEERVKEYPPPVVALLDSTAREHGMISGLRSIRFPSPQ